MANNTLAENLIRLQEAKEDIADAIVEMGGTASSTDGLEDMASKILLIPIPQPTLTTKSIISNGTYDASNDNVDGYSSVTVAVPDSSSVINTGTITNKNAYYVNVTAKSYGKSIVIDGVLTSYNVSLGMSSNYHSDMFEITGLTIPNVSEIKAVIGYYTTNIRVSSSNSYSIGFITSLDTDYVYGTDPYNPRQRLQVIRYNASKLLIAWTIDANLSTRSYYGEAGCNNPFRVAIIF